MTNFIKKTIIHRENGDLFHQIRSEAVTNFTESERFFRKENTVLLVERHRFCKMKGRECFMDQYEKIKEDYLQIKEQFALLQNLLSENQAEGTVAPWGDLLSKLQVLFDRMDRELLENYIDFEKVCDKFPDAIYVADKEGTTLYVNDMYSQMSGISKEEVIGENCHQINEEKKLYTNGIIPKVLDSQKREETIGVMNRTGIKVYITGFPVFDENQKLQYAVAADRDNQQLETVKDQLIKLKEAKDISENETRYLREQSVKSDEMIYKSSQMDYVLSTAMAVAPTDASVLITGESGTGKEVVANEIYKASKRFGKPFLKVNCAAIPESLMESELFGYAPGSFTGASKTGKTGIFELVNHGTLMLDEIGEMSMPMQTKLLRVLCNHEINKIGGGRPIPVDVRIISATNKDLLQCIKEKTFREDLYYRLNVVPIHIPPLRERLVDVDVLAQHFLDRYNRKYNKQVEIYSDALHLLETYDWPGNVRELENVMERLVVINRTNVINRKDVCRVLGMEDDVAAAVDENSYDLKSATHALEKQMIEKALADFSSGRKAAQALGIDHSTLIKKCKHYGI